MTKGVHVEWLKEKDHKIKVMESHVQSTLMDTPLAM